MIQTWPCHAQGLSETWLRHPDPHGRGKPKNTRDGHQIRSGSHRRVGTGQSMPISQIYRRYHNRIKILSEPHHNPIITPVTNYADSTTYNHVDNTVIGMI